MTDKQGQSFALKPAKGLRDAGDGSNSQAFALRSAREEELLVGSRGKAPRLLRLSITLERFHPDRNHPDPVIARRSRRSNLLPDERTSARQAGDCFVASRLAMTGLAGRFHSR